MLVRSLKFERDMPFSAAILCGGLNSRMGGKNKGLLRLNQETFLQRLYRVLHPLVTEIILVTKDPAQYTGLDLKIINDIYPIRSSLAGVHAALTWAENAQVFITACDLPLLKPDLVNGLLESSSPGNDVVVPTSEKYFEPLCAVYSKACLPVIEELLDHQTLKISALFSRVRVKKISFQTLQTYDPELVSFVNVNSMDDLEKVKELTNQSTKAEDHENCTH